MTSKMVAAALDPTRHTSEPKTNTMTNHRATRNHCQEEEEDHLLVVMARGLPTGDDLTIDFVCNVN